MSVTCVGHAPVSPTPLYGDIRPQGIRQQQDIKPEKVSKPQVIQSAAADLQRISTVLNKKLQFVVDHGSNQVIVKVIDKETDKVIKELPPEELQKLHSNLREAMGLLFDEKA